MLKDCLNCAIVFDCIDNNNASWPSHFKSWDDCVNANHMDTVLNLKSFHLIIHCTMSLQATHFKRITQSSVSDHLHQSVKNITRRSERTRVEKFLV